MVDVGRDHERDSRSEESHERAHAQQTWNALLGALETDRSLRGKQTATRIVAIDRITLH